MLRKTKYTYALPSFQGEKNGRNAEEKSFSIEYNRISILDRENLGGCICEETVVIVC